MSDTRKNGGYRDESSGKNIPRPVDEAVELGLQEVETTPLEPETSQEEVVETVGEATNKIDQSVDLFDRAMASLFKQREEIQKELKNEGDKNEAGQIDKQANSLGDKVHKSAEGTKKAIDKIVAGPKKDDEKSTTTDDNFFGPLAKIKKKMEATNGETSKITSKTEVTTNEQPLKKDEPLRQDSNKKETVQEKKFTLSDLAQALGKVEDEGNIKIYSRDKDAIFKDFKGFSAKEKQTYLDGIVDKSILQKLKGGYYKTKDEYFDKVLNEINPSDKRRQDLQNLYYNYLKLQENEKAEKVFQTLKQEVIDKTNKKQAAGEGAKGAEKSSENNLTFKDLMRELDKMKERKLINATTMNAIVKDFEAANNTTRKIMLDDIASKRILQTPYIEYRKSVLSLGKKQEVGTGLDTAEKEAIVYRDVSYDEAGVKDEQLEPENTLASQVVKAEPVDVPVRTKKENIKSGAKNEEYTDEFAGKIVERNGEKYEIIGKMSAKTKDRDGFTARIITPKSGKSPSIITIERADIEKKTPINKVYEAKGTNIKKRGVGSVQHFRGKGLSVSKDRVVSIKK